MNQGLKVENEFFYVTLNTLLYFISFSRNTFSKSPLYKTLTLIIRLIWNVICIF